jgi:hypothetical protein
VVKVFFDHYSFWSGGWKKYGKEPSSSLFAKSLYEPSPLLTLELPKTHVGKVDKKKLREMSIQ